MKTTRSKDGTTIAYEQMGTGPALILVDGAWCHRTFGPMPKLAPLLAARFTVIHYDRRGRGASGPATTTSVAHEIVEQEIVEQEIEDLRALVDAAGGRALMYGTSSGAVLAARATSRGIGVTGLALYEPPLALDGTHHPEPADYIAQIERHLAKGEHGDVAKLFMKVVGVPPIGIFMMRLIPSVWRNMTTLAPTVMHDFAVLGDTQRGGPMPNELRDVLTKIDVPTVVMAGSKSPPWMHHAMKTVAAFVPGATTHVIDGQDHNAAAKAIAPALFEAFARMSSGERRAA
jgi:pimeloyl-ACP methyl ester carboxylesterase